MACQPERKAGPSLQHVFTSVPAHGIQVPFFAPWGPWYSDALQGIAMERRAGAELARVGEVAWELQNLVI